MTNLRYDIACVFSSIKVRVGESPKMHPKSAAFPGQQEGRIRIIWSTGIYIVVASALPRLIAMRK